MPVNHDDESWKTCERMRNGVVCGNKSRRKGGKTCSTCYARIWKENNKDYEKLVRQVLYLKNYDKVQKKMKERYWADPEAARKRSGEWQKANREHCNAYQRARRAQARESKEHLARELAPDQASTVSTGQVRMLEDRK